MGVPLPLRKTAPLDLERRHGGVVVGIDEVGRAPFAGPVMAAAVCFPAWARRPRALAGLTDSKQLTREEREAYSAVIRQHGQVALGAASTAEIDRDNIHHASLRAMARAYRGLGVAAGLALVDGVHAPPLPCPVETVVKGDSRSLSIAAASVVAKVARDRLMAVLARRYPGYGWDSNVGYGADSHYFGLLRLGANCHHRQSFGAVRRFTEDLFAGRFRFRPVTRAAPGIEIFLLRQDFSAVFDGAGHHVGFCKATRRIWQFQAVGYAADGTPAPGGGPYAACHGLAVEAPTAGHLENLFAPHVETTETRHFSGQTPAEPVVCAAEKNAT